MRVYVSLTSIKQKQNGLVATLKSILKQTVLPDKCYLYLSEEPYLLDEGFKNRELSQALTDLIDGTSIFEVIWCDNIGPYRKLLNSLKEKWNEDCLIITIDDDTEYHPSLIERYLHDYQEHKCLINYRGFTMKFNKSIKEINYRDRAPLNPKCLYNFATGKGGIAYHPSFFHKTEDLIFGLMKE